MVQQAYDTVVLDQCLDRLKKMGEKEYVEYRLNGSISFKDQKEIDYWFERKLRGCRARRKAAILRVSQMMREEGR